MGLEDIEAMPDSPERREILRRKLVQGAGPMRFMAAATPAGFLRQNALGIASKVLGQATGATSAKNVDITDVLFNRLTGNIGMNRRIISANESRYSKKRDRAEKSGEPIRDRTFKDAVIEYFVPGSVKYGNKK
jgi:hypothetical protein